MTEPRRIHTLAEDHPIVTAEPGLNCPVCTELFKAGDRIVLVPDPETLRRLIEVRGWQTVRAEVMHDECARKLGV